MALTLLTDGTTYGAEKDGALYNFKTNGDYIFKGIGNEFRATYSSLSLLVTVLSGEGVLCGRHVTEKRIGNSNSQITLPSNSTGYLCVRMNLSADPDTFLYCTSSLTQQDLNNGGTIHDLPLYAYVTGANNVLSFVDLRPISSGNGFILRMENGTLYAYFNGRRKKIATKEN